MSSELSHVSFEHVQLKSKSIKSLSVKELESFLLANALIIDTNPWEEEGFFDMKYEDKVLKIFELLHDVKPKHRDRYRDESHRKHDKFLQVRENILSAYYLVQSMNYEEQKNFQLYYPEQFDKILASLTWYDLSLPNAGFIDGMDFTFECTLDDNDQPRYDHPVLQILSEEKYRTSDQTILKLALDICSQAIEQASDSSEVKREKELFRNEVVYLLSQFPNDLSMESIPPEPKTSEEYRRWLGAYIDMHQVAKQSHPENTGLLPTGWKFMVNGGIGNRRTVLHGISLRRYQENKAAGGHVYGIKFAEKSWVNIEMDLNNSKGAQPGLMEGLDAAYAYLNSGQIDIEGMHILGANYSLHTGTSSLKSVKTLMTWPTNRTSDEHIKRKELIEANIQYLKCDITLNDIRYLSRGKDEKEYTIGIKSVIAKGVNVTDLWMIDEAKSFRNNTNAISQLMYGSMNSMFILTDAVMAAVAQMTSIGKTLDLDDFEGFQNDLSSIRVAGANIDVHMDSLEIVGYLDVTKPEEKADGTVPRFGAIENMKFGAVDLNMKQVGEMSAGDMETVEANREEIRKIEKKLKKLRKKLRKNPEADEFEKIDLEIKKKTADILELQSENAQLLKQNRFEISANTQKPVIFENAYYIEAMVKDLFEVTLCEYWLEDLTGLEDFTLGEGLRFSTTTGINSVQQTRVEIDDISMGTLKDDEFVFDFGDYYLTGTNLEISGIKANAYVSWTDANITEGKNQSEVIDIITEKLGITDGTAKIENLTLTDKKTGKPELKVTGAATLKNMSLQFFSPEEGNYENVLFGCSEIEVHDVAEFQQEVENNPDLKNWGVENKSSFIRLNGFQIRNKALNVKVNEDNSSVETSETALSITSGTAEDFKIDGVKLETGITLLNVNHKKEVFKNSKHVVTGEKSETSVEFGLNEVEMPFVSKQTKDYSIVHYFYPDHKQKDYFERQEKNLSEQYAYIEKVKGMYLYEEDREEAIALANENIRRIKRNISRREDAGAAPSDTLLSGVSGKITFTTERTGLDTKSPVTTTDNMIVNYFKIDRTYTHNLKFTNKKTGEVFRMEGDHIFHGLGVENAIYENGTIDLLEGGRVFGGATSLAWLTVKGFQLNEFGVGGWSFEKLEDDKGYKYSVDDLGVLYNYDSDGVSAEGEVSMSFDGVLKHHKEDKKYHLTFHTEDSLFAPKLESNSFSILGERDGIGFHKISLDADFKYKTRKKKNGDNYKELQKVIINKLEIGRVYLSGTTVTFGEDKSSINIPKDRVSWLNNVELNDVVYDFTKKNSKAFYGNISAGLFDLTHIQNLDFNSSGSDILNLLNTGVKGSALSFTKYYDGNLNINVTSPELFFSYMKGFGARISTDNSDGTLNKRLFKAGSIDYSTKKDNDNGHFITIHNAEFFPVSLGDYSKYNNGDVAIDIKDLVLSGKVDGDLIIDYVPKKYVRVFTEGGAITVDSIDLKLKDYYSLMNSRGHNLRQLMQIQNSSKSSQEEKDFASEAIQQQVEKIEKRIAKGNLPKYKKMRLEGTLKELEYMKKLADPQFKDKWSQLTDELIAHRNKMYDVRRKEKQAEYAAQLKSAHPNWTANQIHQEMAGRVSNDFNFLDQFTQGIVEVSLFGIKTKMPLVRFSPNGPTLSYPANPTTESKHGGGYFTGVKIDSFVQDISDVLTDRVSGYWLNNAIEDGDLKVKKNRNSLSQEELALYVDPIVESYTVTLLANLNDANHRRYVTNSITYRDTDEFGVTQEVTVNEYADIARLSSVVDTLVYNQSSESMVMEAKKAGGITGSVTDAIMEGFYESIHGNLDPQLIITGGRIDMDQVDPIDQGLLGFVNSNDPVLFDFNFGLNQDQRHEFEFFEKRTWKQLGPELTIKNFKMPPYMYNEGQLEFWGDGIEIEELGFGKKQTRGLDFIKDINKDDSAWLKGKNITFQRFELKIDLSSEEE